MLELLLSHVEAHLSWRWLLQVVLLSGGLTLAALWSFRDDARSRRGLGVAAVWLLTLVPLVLLLLQPRYQIGVQTLPDLPVLAPVPWFVLALWLTLAAWGCANVALHVWRAQRGFRNLKKVDDVALSALARAYCARLDMAQPTIVYGANACAGSLGKARLMVPAEFLSWPAVARRAVIAHELVHLKRRDDRFMIALQVLARCYLFCPWLHLLYSRFVHSLEEACDERAAELIGARAEYLEGLAEAALREGGGSYAVSSGSYAEEPAQEREPGLLAAAHLIAASHKSLFMRRVARLLDKQRFFEVQSGPLTAGTGLGLLVLCVLTTFEFVEVPRTQFAVVPSSSFSIVPLAAYESGHEQMTFAGESVRPEVRVINTTKTNVRGMAGVNQAARTERITPAIVYPGHALMDGIEGQVLMEFSIANDGSTVLPRVIRSTHPTYFNSTAKRAVQQTVYTPNYGTGFSGVTAAYREQRKSERVATPRVQKLFVFDLGKDPAPQTVPTQASIQ